MVQVENNGDAGGLKLREYTYFELPKDLDILDAETYMHEQGMERAFFVRVAIPVSQIELDEDVIDYDHVDRHRSDWDLDNQGEEVSLVFLGIVDGEPLYAVTNGHHRIELRKQQAEERNDSHLTIKALVRVGTSESEIYEMRLADLNKDLSGVLFLRASRWINRAFYLRKWETPGLREVVRSGQLTPALAMQWANTTDFSTNMRYELNEKVFKISRAEKDLVADWAEKVTRRINLGFPKLREYLEVADIAVEELVKMVDIKSGGGGYEGHGKFTFDLLKQLIKVFDGRKHPDLQIAIANQCVKNNISALQLKGTDVLSRLRIVYERSDQNLDDPHVQAFLNDLHKIVEKNKTVRVKQSLLTSRNIHGLGNSSNETQVVETVNMNGRILTFEQGQIKSNGSEVKKPAKIITHEQLVQVFHEARSYEIEQGAESSRVIQLEFEEGLIAYFDSRLGILISFDDKVTEQLTKKETEMLAYLDYGMKNGFIPTPEQYRTTLFPGEFGKPVKLNERIEKIRSSLKAKLKSFKVKYAETKPEN